MAIKELGISVFRTSSAAEHELGITVDDPRGGAGVSQFTEQLPVQSATGGVGPTTTTRRYDAGGEFKYVQANGTISAGDAVQIDATFGAGTPAAVDQRHATVIRGAASAVIEGIAMSDMNTTDKKFGCIQIAGKHYAANVPDAVADGAVLVAGAAGVMAASGGTAPEAQAIAAGRSIRKIADSTEVPGGTGLTNKGVVLIS
jgi:hypothetical protein